MRNKDFQYKILDFTQKCINFILSVFFLYTGIFKIIKVDSFKLNVSRAGVFPESIVNILPYFIASVELIIAFLIILKPKIGQQLFFFIMIVFTFYITYLNSNNRFEVCGCGGILNGLGYYKHLFINLIAISLSLCAILILQRKK